MAGANNVPERLINFRVYNAGNDLLGIATVDLPEIEAMSDTVSGAGIAGEVESPVLGHFSSMTTTFTWRTIELAAMVLNRQEAHVVEVRGSQQVYDAASGTYTSVPVRATMRVIPKTVSLGSFEPGSTTDTEQEFEVLYLKLFVNGIPVVEIDKYNFVANFGGKDALETVRKDLGLSGGGKIASVVNSVMAATGM
ncbi:MAG: phage major tail tube protein [Candidatus Spyradenecus sp.]